MYREIFPKNENAVVTRGGPTLRASAICSSVAKRGMLRQRVQST
jgi:hypothetical protein